MPLPSTPLLSLMRDHLSWVSQRQRVLAENIANADTPGFRPRDVTPFQDQLSRLARSGRQGLAPERTHPQHVTPAADGPAIAAEGSQRRVYETTPTGNAVVLEEQMAKVNDAATAHRLTTELYRAYLGLLRTAANAKG